MDKIASSIEIQAEIYSILAFIQGHGPGGKPDRQVIAAKLQDVADRIASFVNWRELDGRLGHRWVTSVRDPDGAIWNWHILELDKPDYDLYKTIVVTPKGEAFQLKKPMQFEEVFKTTETWIKRILTGASLSKDFIRNQVSGYL